MCAQIISPTWDNHHRLLINAFNELLENNIAVDCTIVAEGHQLKVHKVLLSSFSPFFELLFKEGNEDHPTIILADTSSQDLRALVHFMYSGKLEIPNDRIQNVVETANYLQIRGLDDASKNDISGKTKECLPLQTYSNPYKAITNNPVISVQNDIMESQSYRASVQHQTPPASSAHHVSQSPIHCLTSDLSLEECSEQRLSFPISSRSLSSVVESLSLTSEDLVNVESRDEMFSTESLYGHELENEEVNFCDSNSNSEGQAISEEANICLLSNMSVNSEDNICESVLEDCASSMIDLPAIELYSSIMRRSSSKTLNVSSASGEINNATRDSPFSFMDPVGLESEDFLNFELDLKRNTSEEEIAMLDDVCAAMEQEETLAEDEHIATSGSEYSGVRAQSISSSISSQQTHGSSETEVTSPISLSVTSGADTTVMKNDKTTRCSLKNTVCQICDKSFRSSAEMRKHMQTHSSNKSYKCSHCDYRSKTKGTLIRHERIHNDQRSLKCTQCDYVACSNYNLKRHRRIHTGERPFKCTECDFTATQNSGLILHRRMHTGEKSPFKCTECDYTATQSGSLIRHRLVHTGEKPFKCTECDYAAAQFGSLMRHRVTHTGERPYKCTECDYAATDKSDLLRHRRIHSAVKPYKCPECDYSASRSILLAQHRHKHTGVHSTPYKCVECSFTATGRSDLVRHVRCHNGGTPY